jgi:hypothetical protein
MVLFLSYKSNEIKIKKVKLSTTTTKERKKEI